jgi:ring-1,2-phenylacetyl-CoA epoxidase subunit PaaB
MNLQSLDPRINRLGIPENWPGQMEEKQPLDQFQTFEVFVQHKENKPFEHAGIVHAPNADMAFLFAKEQFTRRGNTCFGLWVVETSQVLVSPYSEKEISIYDMLEDAEPDALSKGTEAYEIFHLFKRGKQHVHAGSVKANDPDSAILEAKRLYGNEAKAVLNIWIVKRDDMLFSDEEDKEIWNTLHEKVYREAIDYKAADKIKQFKEEQQMLNQS